MNKSLTSRIVALVCLGLFTLQSFAGTVTGQVQNAAAGPVRNGTFSFTLTAPATVAGTATVVTSSVPCYTDGNGNVAGEPDPLLAPVLSVNLASGTLPAATYFVKIWYFDGTGNSFVSPEASISLVSIGTLNVLSPVKQPLNASGYRIGISTVSGSETIQGSVTGVPGAWGNFSQSVPLTVPAAAAPVSNTTVCTLRFNDELTPSFTCYDVGLTSSTGANIPGFPQYWYLNGGSAGTINVGSGTPQSNVCQGQGVVYPQAIVTLPPFNATQTVNGGLNLNGFPFAAGVGTFKTINTIRYADQFVGPDICAQISAAIADLPAQGGTVDARAFNVSSSLVCTSGTVTIGSATKPVKLLLPPTIIINNAAVVAFNLVNGAIIGDGTNGIGSRLQNNTASADTLQINGSRNTVRDVTVFRGVASAGASVHLIGSGTTSSNHNYLSNVRADCTSSNTGSVGFQLTGNSATALVAENSFFFPFTDECDVDYQFDTTGTQGPTDNDFYAIHDVNTSGGTVGIKLTGANTAENRFHGGIIANKTTGVSIASGVAFSKFFGLRTESNTANINSAGTGSEFYGLSVDAATITDTDTTSTFLGGGNVSFTQKIHGANVPKRLDTQFLLAPVTGTGAFATLFTTSIPANTLGKNGCVRAHFAYLHSTGTANVSYKITLGATTLQGAWTDAGTAQANSSVTICNRAATNSQGAWSLAVFDGTTIANAAGIAVASEDTTTTLNLALQFSVANTDAVTPRGWIVEMF